MLSDATQLLIATVRNQAATDSEINAAAQSLFGARREASLQEADDALRALGGLLSLEDPFRAGFVASICGVLVEEGWDPLAVSQPLCDRLNSLLESSCALAEATVARIPQSEDVDQDALEIFEETRMLVASEMPNEKRAWDALEEFWRPAIAVFSASAEARGPGRPLLDLAAKISDYHEAGHWLRLILSVLDNEPIIVIEPETMVGILARMSGVVDNFQLSVLLMDMFPGPGLLPGGRVPRLVADVARGVGPQQMDEGVTGVWNMYTWKAVESSLSLPAPNDYESRAFWIWNEGVPGDIPVFEGRRVILLGPAGYTRTWRCQRMFADLAADVACERILSGDEVNDWLQRMVAAKSAG